MNPIKIHNQQIEAPEADYIILAGPTGVGKTETVIQLASEQDIEVISGDSRQIYQYMDIGTATPEAEILELVPHHLINQLTPDTTWDASSFYRQTRNIILEIIDRGKLPVVVGGAGLYLDALRDGLFNEQQKHPELREKYQAKVDAGEAQDLWEKLLKLDPEYAETFHFNNHKKLMRAFEIYDSTGKIPSQVFAESKDPFEKKDLFVVLDRDRKILYERIDQRVRGMLDAGLVSECQSLLRLGFTADMYPIRTIGYKEVYAFLRGELDEADMISTIQKNTRNFAKRQLTWFRNHPFDYWIDLG